MHDRVIVVSWIILALLFLVMGLIVWDITRRP